MSMQLRYVTGTKLIRTYFSVRKLPGVTLGVKSNTFCVDASSAKMAACQNVLACIALWLCLSGQIYCALKKIGRLILPYPTYSIATTCVPKVTRIMNRHCITHTLLLCSCSTSQSFICKQCVLNNPRGGIFHE